MDSKEIIKNMIETYNKYGNIPITLSNEQNEALKDLLQENERLLKENQELHKTLNEYDSYNYLDCIEEDVKIYIEENGGILGLLQMRDYEDCEDLGELKEALIYVLEDEDSITGNASGSYTMNIWQAEQNLAHNLDLLISVCKEWEYNLKEMIESPELGDVLIRRYLLSKAVTNVLEDKEDEFDRAKEQLENQENLG